MGAKSTKKRRVTRVSVDPARDRVSFEPDRDLGPSVRLERDGRQHPWRGAARIDLAERPSGDHPTATVRGARRRNILDDMATRRTITRRQHNAANRLLDDCSIASGGGVGGEMDSVRSNTPTAGLPWTQVSALARVRSAWAVLRLREDPGVFDWVVFKNRTVGSWEDSVGLGHGKGMTRFLAELDLLADHYDDEDDKAPDQRRARR